MELVTICICEYNTGDLTNSLLKSIKKHCNNFPYQIFIVDNSNREHFQLNPEHQTMNITYFDNTKQQLFTYRDDLQVLNSADYKHSKNVQFAMDNCNTNKFLLFDSDTWLKHDIDFLRDDIITASQLDMSYYKQYTRFTPYIQYFNLKRMKEIGIKYLDEDELYNIEEYNNIKHLTIRDTPKNRIFTGVIFTNKILESSEKICAINNVIYINHLVSGNSIENKIKHSKFIHDNETRY